MHTPVSVLLCTLTFTAFYIESVGVIADSCRFGQMPRCSLKFYGSCGVRTCLSSLHDKAIRGRIRAFLQDLNSSRLRRNSLVLVTLTGEKAREQRREKGSHGAIKKSRREHKSISPCKVRIFFADVSRCLAQVTVISAHLSSLLPLCLFINIWFSVRRGNKYPL